MKRDTAGHPPSKRELEQQAAMNARLLDTLDWPHGSGLPGRPEKTVVAWCGTHPKELAAYAASLGRWVTKVNSRDGDVDFNAEAVGEALEWLVREHPAAVVEMGENVAAILREEVVAVIREQGDR